MPPYPRPVEEENEQNRTASQRTKSQQTTRPLEPKPLIHLTCKKHRRRAPDRAVVKSNQGIGTTSFGLRVRS